VEDGIRRVAELILDSRHALALTGAGISTPSGIPDFRSPGSGLWEKVDPLEAMSLRVFRADPASFYRAFHPLVGAWLSAAPNPAHLALAELEALGLLHGVITQNVDDLHQKAGSQRVWEMHGHLREGTCLKCGQVSPLGPSIARYLAEGALPSCPACGGALKPNIILFGEQLPRYTLMEVAGEVEHCDLLLVAGSSLAVLPVADIPFWALRGGAALVILNDAPTPVDLQATVVVRERVERALPRLAELCRRVRAGESLAACAAEWAPPPRRYGPVTIPALPRLPRFSVAPFLPRLPQVSLPPGVSRAVSRLPRPTLRGLGAALADRGEDTLVHLDRLLMALDEQRHEGAGAVGRLRWRLYYRSRRFLHRARLRAVPWARSRGGSSRGGSSRGGSSPRRPASQSRRRW